MDNLDKMDKMVNMVKMEKDGKVGLGKGIKKKGKLQELAKDDGTESDQEDKKGEEEEEEEAQAGEQRTVKVKEIECLSELSPALLAWQQRHWLSTTWTWRS
ncbi:MAG: hypothetical protein LQ337_006583 [Flavoplaca oasis]|nr:MAG: hypothetical protein LQ337_006583 [Flavoplaca oasis]